MNKKINKSDILLMVVYFIVSFSLQGREYYKNDTMLREYLIDFPVDLITICGIIFLFVFWLIPKFVKEKKYVLFAFLGILILVVLTGIQNVVGFWTGDNDWSKFPTGLDFVIEMIDRGSLQTAFPFALLLTKKFYEGQNQLLKFEKQQKENELKLLRSQIDPHFLFNNLNTLDSLIDSDTQRAKEYINRLSLIYRYLIKTKDAEVMELAEEIQLAENYMFLIKTRFGNDYDFKIETTTTLNNKFIPTGAIQALLENVVKHNKPSAGVSVKTVICVEENALKVSNTKSNIIPKNESFGIGIDNLKARYKLLSDKEVIIINTDKEFSVSIPIIKLIEDN
ncbi:histidine kinase [Cellulophaga lytica]|nr:histidine kinase [Cellulophaga lytica]